MFIQSFLPERSFKAREGSTLSELYEQEMEVLQGCILSPVLFSIRDDFALCMQAKSLNRVERNVERVVHLCVNSIQDYMKTVLSSPLQRRCTSTFTSSMDFS